MGDLLIDAIDGTYCPSCRSEAGRFCENTKTGERLPISKTHGRRVRLFLRTIKEASA